MQLGGGFCTGSIGRERVLARKMVVPVARAGRVYMLYYSLKSKKYIHERLKDGIRESVRMVTMSSAGQAEDEASLP